MRISAKSIPVLALAIACGVSFTARPARAQDVLPVPAHWMDGLSCDTVNVAPNQLRLELPSAQARGISVRDLLLAVKVKHKLARDRDLGVGKLQIKASSGGIVRVRGVMTEEQRRKAVSDVLSTEGVRDVKTQEMVPPK